METAGLLIDRFLSNSNCNTMSIKKPWCQEYNTALFAVKSHVTGCRFCDVTDPEISFSVEHVESHGLKSNKGPHATTPDKHGETAASANPKGTPK